MKLAVVVLGALVASAFAEGPNDFNMPNLNMLNGKMPQIPAGMKLDDLRDAFHNMPPSMKDRLNDMAGKFGMQLDDVEDALNNPPPKLKDYFENNGQWKEEPIVQKAGFQGGFKLPTQDERPPPNAGRSGGLPNMGGIDMGSILKNVDMGTIGNMMKGMDIGSMMKGVDMGMVGDLMKNMDIGSMMQGMDMGMMGDIMNNMDMGAMADIMKNVDIGSLMNGMDMGMVGDLMKNMDMGAMGDMMKNVDLGSIAGMMNGMDLGGMMKGMDIDSIGKMVNNKIPKNMKEAKRMMGMPEDASMKDVKNILKDRLEKMGVPLDDPKEMLDFAIEKLRALNIPLPEGVEIADLMNMLHGHLESMGVPTEPEQLKNYVMEQFGLNEINTADLDDPNAIADILKRKAFRMLGINEDEDPMTIKNRIEQQLYEEVQKHGADISKDSSNEEVKQAMNKLMSHQLRTMGLEVESLAPEGLHRAVKNKLSGMGFPMGDMKALKSNVMSMLMKQLMNKAVPMIMPMIMNMFMPHRQQSRPQGPPMMPPMMPHMMPHMMPQMMPHMMPHTMPQMMPALNLDIEVNVEQPDKPMMPKYLQGAERALDHPIEYMDDRQVFQHIMAVREGLRAGEMSEEAVQEMLDDLMQARLQMRVLSVKNMFLRDRIAAMQRMRGPPPQRRMPPTMRGPGRQSHRRPAPFMPRQPARRQSPAIMRALRGQRMF